MLKEMSILEQLDEAEKSAKPSPWYCNIYSGEFYLTHPTANFTNTLPTVEDFELIELMRANIRNLIAVARAAKAYINCINYIPTDEKMRDTQADQFQIISNALWQALAKLEANDET